MYASPSDNYGSSITAKPYGGAIARSLTSRSFTPVTGNRSRDAMSRAMSDQNRNMTEASREQFENSFAKSFQQARTEDVMAQRNLELGDYQLAEKEKIDNATRSLREGQSMRSLASRLAGQKVSDRWNAMMDYTNTFLRPAFIHPEYGLLGSAQSGLSSYFVPHVSDGAAFNQGAALAREMGAGAPPPVLGGLRSMRS